MKRRASLRFRFSNHGLKKEFAEDQGLLTESDDCCEDQSPSRNSIQIRPSCIDSQDEDLSDSWFIQADSHAEESDSREELRNIQCILLHLRPENKEKPNRQLSDLFSRAVKPKIHLSRSKCVVKQESKIFEDLGEVGFYATFYFLGFKCHGFLEKSYLIAYASCRKKKKKVTNSFQTIKVTFIIIVC